MANTLDTQVAIIGGGPSGLLLAQLLHRAGIDSVVLEKRTNSHVLSRIRAGILEQGFVKMMGHAGVDQRLKAEGFTHDHTIIAYDNVETQINLTALTGTPVTVYGQTEVTRDLYHAREAAGGRILFNVEDVQIHAADSPAPHITFDTAEGAMRLNCDFIAGCDGFHGVSRKSIPADLRRSFEKTYPFGWLGVLSQTPPVSDALIYANSRHGFALCSMRNANLSRYYIQCALSDRVEDWPVDRFWDALRDRIPDRAAEALVTGPAIETSIAPLRSFVSEPMSYGRLFLCGDAAHIVPPTGAKGLNTAASDVFYLWQALLDYYENSSSAGIQGYSAKALARVWKAERFSWYMTNLLHRFPDQSGFDLRMQRAELETLADSPAAQTVLAQNYVGLPY